MLLVIWYFGTSEANSAQKGKESPENLASIRNNNKFLTLYASKVSLEEMSFKSILKM